MSKANSVGNLQERAWGYYGYPGSRRRAVGEVRYVNGWLADQMTRLDWDVTLDGSDDWTVDLPDGGTIATGDDQSEASAQLLELIDWDDTNVRGVTTNLFVAGQGDYAELDKGWSVVSTIDPDRKKKLDAADTSVSFIWPHPADPSKPDAPLFAVIELLDELDWLNRQARTQSHQRVMLSGIILTADGFVGPNGTTFWQAWNDTLAAKMIDPDDMSPIRLSGTHELVKDGLNWIMPPFGYDETIDRRVLAAIHRLAYGLPVPPEILLGMQAQSRATAFQVEENAYRAHIEPPALMIAQVAAEALSAILDDREVDVIPNPSRLLARVNSVQDVKDAYDRGLVKPEYVREVLNIPEDAAPENDGVAPASTAPAADSDPSNDAADEASPINASVGDTELSTLLADIDAALASELAGVTVMATDRARQRLGAAARANKNVRDNPNLKGLTSGQLATQLGYDGLTAAGVDFTSLIAEPVDAATRWWVRRVGEAWSQAAELIPGWSGQGDWVTESVDVLATGLVDHIIDTLSDSEVSPMQAPTILAVLDTAAGGNS